MSSGNSLGYMKFLGKPNIQERRRWVLGFLALWLSFSSEPTPLLRKCHRRVRNIALKWTVWFLILVSGICFLGDSEDCAADHRNFTKIQARHHCLWSLQSARARNILEQPATRLVFRWNGNRIPLLWRFLWWTTPTSTQLCCQSPCRSTGPQFDTQHTRWRLLYDRLCLQFVGN